MGWLNFSGWLKMYARQPPPPIFIAGLFYFIMNGVVSKSFDLIETPDYYK